MLVSLTTHQYYLPNYWPAEGFLGRQYIGFSLREYRDASAIHENVVTRMYLLHLDINFGQ